VADLSPVDIHAVDIHAVTRTHATFDDRTTDWVPLGPEETHD